MVSVALVFDEDSPDKSRDVGGETGRDASAPVASAELPKDPTPDVSGAQESQEFAKSSADLLEAEVANKNLFWVSRVLNTNPQKKLPYNQWLFFLSQSERCNVEKTG